VKFVLNLNTDKIALSKSINFVNFDSDNEVEITEEQYNEINDFPLKLTIKSGKVVAWEKTEIEYEPIPERPKEPTEEDYLIDLDFRVSKIELGLEV